jgi:hypothetical protein
MTPIAAGRDFGPNFGPKLPRTRFIAKKRKSSRNQSGSGSLKFLHHFGLNRSATLGEQLILQDWVTQSISSPGLAFAFAGAAAVAAGDKFL